MRYKILIVEDDKRLRMTLEDYLSVNDFDVCAAETGQQAIELFEIYEDQIHLVLLDGMLPDIDGYDVLEWIRTVSSVPVIILSARESERDMLSGFKYGADVYLTKPFRLSVLKAQIQALLARTVEENEEFLQVGALKVDTAGRRFFLNDRIMETTPREYEVLLFLLKNEKIVMDRNTILNNVWGYDYYGDDRTVDTIVKQLRKKLTKEYPYIKSVYGVGYYFEA